MAPRRSPRLLASNVSSRYKSLQLPERNEVSGLPLEVRKLICSHLTQPDLLSLTRMDKRICEAAYSYLYEVGTINLRFGYGPPPLENVAPSRVIAGKGPVESLTLISHNSHPRGFE